LKRFEFVLLPNVKLAGACVEKLGGGGVMDD
jgi:hypothetical protein